MAWGWLAGSDDDGYAVISRLYDRMWYCYIDMDERALSENWEDKNMFAVWLAGIRYQDAGLDTWT